ncbi:MAG: penicillin-binding protein [Oscillospiraceae bacterium]|nr:penicillin-binding protein [Oscillospiraceae bacterium]
MNNGSFTDFLERLGRRTEAFLIVVGRTMCDLFAPGGGTGRRGDRDDYGRQPGRGPQRGRPQDYGPESGSRYYVRQILRYVGRVVGTIALIGVITGCIVGAVSFLFITTKLDRSIDFDLLDLPLSRTSIIYVQNAEGQTVKYQELHGSENRTWVNSDQIPQAMKDAVVSIEDKRFWEHDGVDWRRTIFAFYNMITKERESQGGSTITQQLIKNITKEDQTSIDRKLKEIFKAQELEKMYDKEVILEAYLNVIALGNGCHGVEAAAQTYFDKHIWELDTAECAAIASITKNPNQYNPLSRPEKNAARRVDVLYFMREQGRITEEEYQAAKDQELVFNEKAKYNPEILSYNNWYVDQIIYDVIRELQEKCGYTKTEANMAVYNRGLKIYSCMDVALQTKVENLFTDMGAANFGPFSGSVKPQCAIVMMDYQGAIKAVGGARGMKRGDLVQSMATQTRRQPGSSIKPIAAYAPAVDFGILEYSTPVPNMPINVGGKSWPKNSGGSYSAMVTLVHGVRISANCVAVRVARELTPQRSFDFMTERLNVGLIAQKQYSDGVKGDINLSMALGGLTEGVTVREMAAAYVIFGSAGKFYEPHTYTEVRDYNDAVLITHGVDDYEQAITPESACIMNYVLRAPLTSGGTSVSAAFTTLPTFGKTGTTSDMKDRYFCGGTPYYVAACWFGYEMPKRLEHGTNYALQTWKKVMQLAHEGLPTDARFPQVAGVVAQTYCTESGAIAGPGCPSTSTGYYSADSDMPLCPFHAGGEPNESWSRYIKDTIDIDQYTSLTTEETTEEPTTTEDTTTTTTTTTTEETTTTSTSVSQLTPPE